MERGCGKFYNLPHEEQLGAAHSLLILSTHDLPHILLYKACATGTVTLPPHIPTPSDIDFVPTFLPPLSNHCVNGNALFVKGLLYYIPFCVFWLVLCQLSTSYSPLTEEREPQLKNCFCCCRRACRAFSQWLMWEATAHPGRGSWVLEESWLSQAGSSALASPPASLLTSL